MRGGGCREWKKRGSREEEEEEEGRKEGQKIEDQV